MATAKCSGLNCSTPKQASTAVLPDVWDLFSVALSSLPGLQEQVLLRNDRPVPVPMSASERCLWPDHLLTRNTPTGCLLMETLRVALTASKIRARRYGLSLSASQMHANLPEQQDSLLAGSALPLQQDFAESGDSGCLFDDGDLSWLLAATQPVSRPDWTVLCSAQLSLCIPHGMLHVACKPCRSLNATKPMTCILRAAHTHSGRDISASSSTSGVARQFAKC